MTNTVQFITPGLISALVFHVILFGWDIPEALSVLMLCALSNRRRPSSYRTKMADFEYFRVLSVFS